MSRREYKTIKRRMQNGRYAAISEGKWPYNSAPYGFRRVKLEKEKGWTLAFDENEAPVVRLIFLCLPVRNVSVSGRLLVL